MRAKKPLFSPLEITSLCENLQAFHQKHLEYEMDNGKGAVSLIVNGSANDMEFLNSALRIPHRKIIVIGESQQIRDAVTTADLGASVEFMPAGTVPPAGSMVFDATQHKA